MNDKNMMHRFNDDLIKIQNHQPVTSVETQDDYVQLLQIANQLTAFSSVPLSQNRQNIKQHLINTASNNSSRHHARPRLSFVTALGSCLILALFSMVIPPVRTFAQNILQNIGNFFFVDQPTDAENYVATMQSGIPTATLNPTLAARITPQVYESELLTAAAASAKAGFPVYTLGYVPDGFTLTDRDILFTGQTITADTSYRMELDPPLHDGLQMSAVIALDQTLTNENTDPWITGTGDIPVVEVTLRGVKGGWIEQIPIYPFQNEEGEWDYARWNQLIWSENGFTFVLQTNLPVDRLPLEEMLIIAESLTK